MRARFPAATVLALLTTAGALCDDSGAACNRACLEGFVNQYLDALAAHNPSALPLAPQVKFSENEQVIPLGEGLWGTATALGTYKLYFSDAQAGQAGFFGTLRENGMPVAIALRLKIENRRVREVESLVVRDAAAARKIEAMGRPDPLFSEALPASQRRSRNDLTAAANQYYDGIEQSDGDIVPFDAECSRVQNGIRTTNNPELRIDPNNSWTPLSLGCKEQLGTRFFSFVRKINPRRFPIVDEERGLVFAFAEFLVPGTVKSVDIPGHGVFPIPPPYQVPVTIEVAELYKIVNGRIRKVEALQTNVPYGVPNPFSRRKQVRGGCLIGPRRRRASRQVLSWR